ncbi:MAG: helix-turn-helix domain-containing protein [Bacillota bacterium]
MENKLKEIRSEMGLTQKKLAEKSGVSRTVIAGIESGSTFVTTTKTLCRLADSLGKAVSEIFFLKCV